MGSGFFLFQKSKKHPTESTYILVMMIRVKIYITFWCNYTVNISKINITIHIKTI